MDTETKSQRIRAPIRTSIAVLVGIVCAFFSLAAIESYGHKVYPVPNNIDWSDAEQVLNYYRNVPAGAILFILGSWIGGALVGALAASIIARTRAVLVSVIVGAIVLGIVIISDLITPNPSWMMITGAIGIIAAVFLVGKIMSVRRR